jgi:hypothetical protein
MPFQSLKNWSFHNALNKLLKKGIHRDKNGIKSNPAQSFLLIFNGTLPRDVDYFRSLHLKFEAKGIRPKMLAYVHSKVDVHDFGMAMYNDTQIKWNWIPKIKLVELVQSREFDILFNINPEQLPHLHYLSVAAKASFKISTLTDFPNDFSLMVKMKPDTSLHEIFEQMHSSMEILTVRD